MLPEALLIWSYNSNNILSPQYFDIVGLQSLVLTLYNTFESARILPGLMHEALVSQFTYIFREAGPSV